MLGERSWLKDPAEGKEVVVCGLELKGVLTEDVVPVPFPVRLEGVLIEDAVKDLFCIIREDVSIDDIDDPLLAPPGIRLMNVSIDDSRPVLSDVTVEGTLTPGTVYDPSDSTWEDISIAGAKPVLSAVRLAGRLISDGLKTPLAIAWADMSVDDPKTVLLSVPLEGILDPDIL